jgi:epoxyqueuosine reductase
MTNHKADITKTIKQLALQSGFSFCGISKAGFLEEEAPRLEKWLKNNMHGKMQYMENHFDKRLDPTILVPGAKSVISVLLNYYTDKKQSDPEAPKISTYAYGNDYHTVIKNKLHELIQTLQTQIGNFTFRVFVDSAPVLDKAWAKKSGLGWVGKNANLINKEMGSFFFIAEIICDLDLEYDTAIKDYCGTCTACIDACPTDAIVEPYVVDGSKCISYFTIELKDELIPKEFKGKMENWMFGCDICQDVCPWNRFSSQHSVPEFDPTTNVLDIGKNEWKELTEEIYKELFKLSPIKRTGFKGLKRNINFLE